MKTTKLFAPIVFVLLFVLSFALWTAKNTIQNQNKEIEMLRTRVDNLEIVINHEYLPAGYKQPDDTI